jgi:hypothetical protein
VTLCVLRAALGHDPRRGTEVPRRKLVDALEEEADVFTTRDSQALVTPWNGKEVPIL